MNDDALAAALEGIEAMLLGQSKVAGEVALAYVAGRRLAIEDDELNAARRRATFVLAAGGDPHREIALEDPAVRALATDLDAPERRLELEQALAALLKPAEAFPLVRSELKGLLIDGERAWLAYACALVAEALGEEG